MRTLHYPYFLFTFIFSIYCFAQNNSNKDIYFSNQYKQIIKDDDVRINYSKEELDNLSTNQFKTSSFAGNKITDIDVSCDVLWQDIVFGTCIGSRNNLISFDYDNDGINEIISNAILAGLNGRGLWYILKYNPITSSYEKVFVSDFYKENIRNLVLFDIDDMGTKGLLISEENRLHIFNLSSFTTVGTIVLGEFNNFKKILEVKYDDTDNDGKKEIVVTDEDYLFLINKFTYEIEHSFAIDGQNFEIGNVDADEALEVVFVDGLVFEINPEGALVEEYIFRPKPSTYGGNIALSDIDGDNYQEVIVASKWEDIGIYDIESETLKYEISLSHDMGAFLVQDVNDDGVEEILYGDGQWKKISCHDSKEGTLLWGINNPETNSTGLAVSDFDGDGALEITWGTGCPTSGPDYLYVYGIDSQNLEWQSLHIGGSHYAVEIEDIDQDGNQEIIALSISSDSGYGSSILTVYDATTKFIEFQSDGNFFEEIWTGVFDVEIVDYKNDGDLDIVVAAGWTYQGRIWVVDGGDYTIEADHLYEPQDDIFEFYAVASDDIDQDGVLEFITTTNYNIYVIDSETFEVEWNSSLPNPFDSKNLLVGDIDGDSNNEIISCNRTISTYDNGTYAHKESTANNYTSIALWDWDEEGGMEIIAGTNNGYIQVIDGITLELLDNFQLTYDDIDGIQVVDLNDDGEKELVISSDGQIHYMLKTGRSLSSQELGVSIGKYNSLAIKDFDEDGALNIVMGTSVGLMEISPSCAECLWFAPTLEKTNATCGEDNGKITVLSADETTVFSWNGVEFMGELNQLEAGTYTIMASNSMGCTSEHTFTIEQMNVEADIIVTDKSCFEHIDGSISVEIQEGLAPFEYQWSNGSQTQSLSNLDVGEYSLILTDANGCTLTEQVEISSPNPLEINLDIVNDDLSTSDLEGAIEVSVKGGTPPYLYNWNNGATSPNINNLGEGSYSLVVIDANQCKTDTTIQLNIITSIAELPDNYVNLFPNPTSDYLFLEFNRPLEDSPIIRIFTIEGKEVGFTMPHSETSQQKILLLDNPQSGIYTLVFQLKQNLFYKKIIVAK